MKAGTKAGLIVAGVLAVAGTAVFVTADTIVKKGVEAGSEEALGAPVSVGGVNLGVLGGTFGITSYAVRNPKGFTGDRLFSLDRADLAVGLGTVLKDTVVVERLSLDGIAVDLEMVDGKTNYGAVLDHMKDLRGKGGDTSGKRLIIDDLVIRNVNARAHMKASKLGVDREVTVQIPEIHMRGVGRKDGGVTVSQLVSIVLARVVDTVLREGADIPGQLRAALEGRMQGLLKEHRGLMEGVSVSEGENAVKDAANTAAEKAAEKAKDSIKGLLKGN